MTEKLEAIILKSWDWKEVDRIYTIFSRQKGKQRIVAKGVRKVTAKLASGVEPVTFSEIFLIKGKWLDRLTGVIIVQQYGQIKQDLQKIKNVKLTFELLDQLAPEKEASEEIFVKLVFYLDYLDSFGSIQSDIAGISLQLVQLGLLWKIIKWAGYQPDFYYCPGCSKKLPEKETYWFHFPRGIECGNCPSNNSAKKMRVSKDTVKILRVLMDQDLKILPKLVVSLENLKQLRQSTKLMLEDILGRRVCL